MTQRWFRRVVWLATVAVGVCTTSQSQSVSLGALPKPIQAALEETEFRSWPLQWVTELDYEGFRYKEGPAKAHRFSRGIKRELDASFLI
jgi:hypothetical protein